MTFQTGGNNLRHGITKTYLYNFDPLKPHFYTVKLGFTGVYIIFLISAQKHRLWVKSDFFTENFQFFELKCSIYLNRHVFVMVIPPKFHTLTFSTKMADTNSADPDQFAPTIAVCRCKQCRPWSVCSYWSSLLRFYTVCHSTSLLVSCN